MTICVSVKVAEGLVFASDSVVTLTQTQGLPNGQIVSSVVQTFNYANKVTHFKTYPIAVMSWGLASIGVRSVQSLIMECEYQYQSIEDNPQYTVEGISRYLVDFMRVRYEAEYPAVGANTPPPNLRVLGLLIGGYSADAFFADVYQCEFPTVNQAMLIRPDTPDGKPNFGANWYGMTDAIVRLILGFDPPGLNELTNRGVDPNVLNQYAREGFSELKVAYAAMPLQDAIDYAEFLAQVTIGRYRFGVGIPLCGGDIDIAVMRPKRFEWARRKQWSIKE